MVRSPKCLASTLCMRSLSTPSLAKSKLLSLLSLLLARKLDRELRLSVMLLLLRLGLLLMPGLCIPTAMEWRRAGGGHSVAE